MTRKSTPEPVVTCACSTLRQAARSVARIYETRLARVGLTTTQYSILRALQRQGAPVPLSRLAEELVLERTSLYRALEPLRRRRLMTLVAVADKRVKAGLLTPAGAARIAQAMPHWKEAQRIFLDRFGRSSWAALSAELGDVVAAVQSVS